MTAPGSESLAFANMVRVVGTHARAAGLVVPGYRSPPATGLDRSIRRRPDGIPTVAVRVKGRPALEVLLDIVDGLAAVNDIGPGHRDITIIRTAAITDLDLGATRTATG